MYVRECLRLCVLACGYALTSADRPPHPPTQPLKKELKCAGVMLSDL